VLKDFVPARTTRKVLDVGTYGEVQLMQNMTNHKLYAMKVIRKALVNEIIPLKILFKEIMIHKKLVHPNIVRLVDHFEDTTRLYIILEYLEKGSLFDLLRKKIKLQEPEACDILIQTLIGLNYLHTNDIMHRDIKPENLLISRHDYIKICDFGWSATGPEKKLTFCGTLDYMSPEMLNSEPHTPKIDIWAVGILLYEMLHGSPPFRGKNPKEQYRLVSNNSYSINQNVSKPAASLIRSILQLRPESRPSILEILSSDFVKFHSESKLRPGQRIENSSNGSGVITLVSGKVVTVQFEASQLYQGQRGSVIRLIEADLYRKFFVYDENGNMVFQPPEEENLNPRNFAENPNVAVNTLYRNLGIDSGRVTPISGRATPISSGSHSRNNSRKSGLLQPEFNVRDSRSSNAPRTQIETSPPLADRPPRNSRNLEEFKRSHPVIPKPKEDFKRINLSPDPFSPSGAQVKQRSSFLARFKANS
jgi:serine/threonine protein kinase